MQKWLAEKILNKVKKDYQVISDEFDISRQYKWKEFDQYLKYIKDGDKLVDLGCGNGRFLGFIKKNRNIDYIGIDNSVELIKKAQKNFSEAKFINGDMLNLPLGDNSQDVVVAIASLHHIPSKSLREKAIKEMYRVLKKDGILIVSVWNLYQKKYKKYIRRAFFRHYLALGMYDKGDLFIPWGDTGVKRYYYALNDIELRNILVKNEFKIIKNFTRNNLVFVCSKQ